jgi:hypothetical protein
VYCPSQPSIQTHAEPTHLFGWPLRALAGRGLGTVKEPITAQYLEFSGGGPRTRPAQLGVSVILGAAEVSLSSTLKSSAI